MSLIQRIMNPQALTALYGSDVPLDGAEIVEVRLGRDEPRLSVRIMTARKPLSPPSRWPTDYDVVYLNLSFIGASDLSLEGWGRDNVIATFSSTVTDNGMSITIHCREGVSIALKCDWVRVEGVAYGYLGGG
ncbi:immunity 50 family protein [Burkholderia pseudomultivorans]|uniref:immunity 50 family protein n=1 Tax=Burkholderia pseudomultivorans TaxID=1207504 RepID=UPI00287548ED|nr:immunity 50 family protein [Burkholderia pseudomultivorans]MDS0794830.1 immunity 50 family protein [Burkholderia pseudomultivorans]